MPLLTESQPKITHYEGDQAYQIEVSYDLGGMNYFTGNINPRGYSLSVRPVAITEREGGYRVVSYKGFSGVRYFLKGVTRKSKKAEREAIEMANDDLIRELMDKCDVNE